MSPKFDTNALFTEAWTDFTENLAGYALAELGRLGALLMGAGLGYAAMMAAWGVLALGAMVTAVAGVAVVTAVDPAYQDLVVGVLAMLFYAAILVFSVGFLAVLSVGASALFVPIQLSTYRATADHLAGRAPIGASAAFAQVARQWPTTLAVTAGLVLLVCTSWVLSWVPLLAAWWLLGFVLPAVALGDRGVVSALAQNARALVRNPGPYLLLATLCAGVGIAGVWVPVFGGGFASALRMRATRALLAA